MSDDGPSTQTPDAVDKASEDSKQEEDTLPFLQRPLGVDDPPTTYKKSWKEKAEELMDQDFRLARRRHM